MAIYIFPKATLFTIFSFLLFYVGLGLQSWIGVLGVRFQLKGFGFYSMRPYVFCGVEALYIDMEDKPWENKLCHNGTCCSFALKMCIFTQHIAKYHNIYI